MSSFNNYLTLVPGTNLRDYQHATRLYLDGKYAKVPKFGFLYFVKLNINNGVIIDQSWEKSKNEVGLLAKKLDLPKFGITSETLNQYNRKTVVQTKLTYQPISITFHDDNSNITHNLWVNYFRHYFADSNYNDPTVSSISGNNTPESFQDTKYGTVDYTYGKYDRGREQPFFQSIEIYVMYQGKFTKYTLVNPKITEWAHDSLDQSEGNKIQQNRMNIAYENVFYATGTVQPGKQPEEWALSYYDNAGSPLKIAGNQANANQSGSPSRSNSNFDKPGPDRVYGRVGGQASSPNPLLDIAMILAKNYVNKNGLTRLGPTGYNIAQGALGALSSGPGKFASPPTTQDQPGIFTLPGGVGINIFKGFNTSVDGKIRANPASIIFPPRG